jgi:hypothetical protein
MDSNIAAVLLSCLLYSLYVLLPMVPAIVIYRFFPDTKVAVSGPLANLTMKSTGAFAAYVVVVILGFFLVKNTHTIISGMVHPMWTIKAQVELHDTSGQKIDDQDLLKFVDVFLKPDLRTREGNFIRLQVPSAGVGKPEYLINFKVPQFGERTIDTSELKAEDISEDRFNRVLKILKPISIQQARTSASPYKETNYLQALPN